MIDSQEKSKFLSRKNGLQIHQINNCYRLCGNRTFCASTTATKFTRRWIVSLKIVATFTKPRFIYGGVRFSDGSLSSVYAIQS